MQACLDSLPAFIDRGVIVYHESPPGVTADTSISIAQQFVKENPGFRLVKYPLPIIHQDSSFIANNLGARNDIDRYWLLDSFYNFALAALIELAIDNGEYDKAWLFKIDCDHVYNPRACLASFRQLYHIKYCSKVAPHTIMLCYSKYNVARNYALVAEQQASQLLQQFNNTSSNSDAPISATETTAGTSKLTTSEPEQTALEQNQQYQHLLHTTVINYNAFNDLKPTQQSLLNGIVMHQDHMLLKLSHISNFNFIMHQEQAPSLATVNTNKITKFNNWERLNVSYSPNISKEKQILWQMFLNSFHFHLEKHMNDNPSVATVLRSSSQIPNRLAYRDYQTAIDAIETELYFKTTKLDPFWSPENLQRTIASLNYPDYSKPLQPFRNIDYEQLLSQPKYRMENFLQEFKAKKNDRDLDRNEYDFMHRCITRLRDQLTQNVILESQVNGHCIETEIVLDK